MRPIRILHVKSVDEALDASPSDVVRLTATEAPHNLSGGAARRDPTEGSAFWPERDPRTRQEMIDKGYGEEVQLADRIAPELSLAVSKGFPIPPALKSRAVFEVYRVMLAAQNPRDRLRAAALLERMERAATNPNTLPDQLTPGHSSQVVVNVQNNVSSVQQSKAPASIAKGGSVTVAELIDEMLSRTDVQEAIDREVPKHGEDYGI